MQFKKYAIFWPAEFHNRFNDTPCINLIADKTVIFKTFHQYK